MSLIACGACGTPCGNHGQRWQSFCRACSRFILRILRYSSPSYSFSYNSESYLFSYNSEGFLLNCTDAEKSAIEQVKKYKTGYSEKTNILAKKQYGAECPCGLVPSQCEYHSC